MEQDKAKLLALREEIFTNKLSRRDVLKRATAFGLSVPVIATLLAACGDDDEEEPTATTAPSVDPTATEAEEEETEEEEEPTATEAEEEETEEEEEPTATEEAEETETEEAEETEEPSGDDFDWQESGPRDMGIAQEEGTPGGTIIESSFSDISTTNPILSADTSSSDLHAMIFESLIQGHPETIEPVGDLAEAWAVNEDATQWTFRLRQGVTWHDGEDFTAQDVKTTYDIHMNPDSGSPRTSDFESKIASVDIIDDYTIQFNLVATLVDMPLDLGVYNIVADHIWADTPATDIINDGGSTGQDPARVVGTGPFKFEEWVTTTYRSVVRNDDYWGGAPYLDRYVILQVADQSAGVQQLLTGEVDWSSVPEASVPEFANSDVTLFDYPTLTFTFYGYNMNPEVTPVFQDKEVRQALVHALDREALIQSIRFGYGVPAVGTMPVLSWAYNPQGIENHYEYDTAKAIELLESAGWMPGADGIREKDGVRLAFQMNTNAGNQVREAYLVAFQEYWAQIGVEMTPNFIPFDVLVEQITTTQDFETFLVGFSWSATPDQAALFSCDGGFNGSGYCNEEVDALLDQARTTVDQAERIEIFTEYQNVLLEDMPMPVIDFPQAIVGVNSRVHNLLPNAVNIRYNTEKWWVEQ